MTTYRQHLPQLEGNLFLTDGGIETTLMFQEGLDLPYFAAFHLLKDEPGTEALRRYFTRHAAIARRRGVGFILESATWRANSDWGEKLGYSTATLAEANRKAIALLHELRAALETDRSPMVISGCVGPRGDGYDPGAIMSPKAAEVYHAVQIKTFAETGADMVTAITMTNVNEALGVVQAARAAGMPVGISFTVETGGKLPTGQPLQEAIQEVDAATDTRLLHDQLRSPEALRDGSGWPRVDGKAAWHPRQCIEVQSRRARRGDGSRRWQSGRTRPAVRRPARAVFADQRARRLLWDRPPAYRANCDGLHGHS